MEPSQTVIILDYDDTLFPTTWLRKIGLPWQVPLQRQLDASEEDEDLRLVERLMLACEQEAEAVLRLCAKLSAGVFVVTLAKRGWVDLTCKNFTPRLGSALQELGIPIMYAREYVSDEQQPNVWASAQAQLKYWSDVKRAAIAEGVGKFYRQYEGQTWKNIISIGDSDFEREATKSAIEMYFRDKVGDNPQDSSSSQPRLQSRVSADLTPTGRMQGVGGTHKPKVVKVRCKTVTLLDHPAVEEVMAQCRLLRRWLSPMVQLEKGTDIRFDDIINDGQIDALHLKLTGQQSGPELQWESLLSVDGSDNDER